MPYALILIGIVLLTSAIKGDLATLGALLKRDLFSPTDNFLYWVVAIFILGAIGYVKSLRAFSDAFLLLVIVVFVVANKGFFGQFTTALAAIKAGNCPTTPASTSSTSSNPWLGIGNGTSMAQPALPNLLPQSTSNPTTGFSFTVSPGG